MSNFANPELDNYFRRIILPSNTPSAPSIVFANDVTKGLYWDPDGIHLSGLSASPTDPTEAASKAYVDAQGGGGVTYPLLAPDGTVGAPSYGFSTNASGVFLDGSGNLNLTSPANGNYVFATGNSYPQLTSPSGVGILLSAEGNAGSFIELDAIVDTPNVSMNVASGGVFKVIDNNSGHTGLQCDTSVTAGDTRLLLWDVTAATLQRVSIGAADSGGTGFRVLRIPN